MDSFLVLSLHSHSLMVHSRRIGGRRLTTNHHNIPWNTFPNRTASSSYPTPWTPGPRAVLHAFRRGIAVNQHQHLYLRRSVLPLLCEMLTVKLWSCECWYSIGTGQTTTRLKLVVFVFPVSRYIYSLDRIDSQCECSGQMISNAAGNDWTAQVFFSYQLYL